MTARAEPQGLQFRKWLQETPIRDPRDLSRKDALTNSPNVRKVTVAGRLRPGDFSLCWDGERNTLHTGELGLETRVFHAIAAAPGISRTRLRAAVTGKAKDVDAAVDALERRRLIEQRPGVVGAKNYHVRPLSCAEGLGQGRDRVGTGLFDDEQSDVGQGGTGVGQGLAQPPHVPLPTGERGTGVADDVRLERLAIEQEGLAAVGGSRPRREGG